jgi:hypothetical protein
MVLALENRSPQIFRFDPSHPSQAVQELNVSSLMQSALKTRVNYGIAAYNNMLPYPDPVNPTVHSL